MQQSLTKPEYFASRYLVTCNGWTPVPFDMFNNEIRALEVTYIVTYMISVKRVSQVATPG